MILQLRVAGIPQPKGSMKCVGRGGGRHQLVEDDKTGERRRWRKTLTEAAQQLAGRLPDSGDAGVIVGVLALVPRPASAARRALPTTRSAGDADKLFRAVGDALDQAGVYTDDSRIVLALSAKAYAPDGTPGAIIWVAPVGTRPGRILDLMLDFAPALRGGEPTLI
jgi:Holliday junction resolvase RusA-like endonuclease